MHLKKILIHIASFVVAAFLTNAALSEENSKPGEAQNRTKQPYEEVAEEQAIDRDDGCYGDAGVSDSDEDEGSTEEKSPPIEPETGKAVQAQSPEKGERDSSKNSGKTGTPPNNEGSSPPQPESAPNEPDGDSGREVTPDQEMEYRLEPVVVTAEKQSLRAQEEQAAKTELTETEIHDMDIKSMADLSRQVPNLEFNDYGSRRLGIMFVRGIKTISKGEPSVSYYVDGINYSKSQMFGFPLFDVEHIEVVKGPQGTLYGRNTMGGVINIFTKQPGDETTGTVGATFGTYGRKELRGHLSAPVLKKKLFVGVYGLLAVREGYAKNDVHAVGEDGRHQDGKSGRVKITYIPAKAWEINMSIDLQHHDDGAYPLRRTRRNALVESGMFDVDAPYRYSHDFESSSESTFWGGSLRLKNESDAGTFISLTGYRDNDTKEMIDVDFSPLDRMRKHYVQKDKDITQEFRFSSYRKGRPFNWVVGLYFFYLDGSIDETNIFGADAGDQMGRRVYFESRSERLGPALFGQATYIFFKRLDLTAGLRLEYEHAQFKGNSLDTLSENETVMEKGKNFFAVLPKLAVSWHITDNHVAYGTISLAHRSGGFNAMGAPARLAAYDPEYSWLNEIGLKACFLEKSLQFKLAGFYTRIYREQLPLMDADSLQSYLQNAGESHRLGVELEGRYRIVPGLDISAGFAWLDARYDKYSDTVADIDYKGKRVFGVPLYTYGAAINYRRFLFGDWALFGRVGANGVGTRFFDDANTVKEDPYFLLNLKLGLEEENMEGYFWMKNIIDKQYTVFENTIAGVAQDGAPRELGVSVNFRF